MPDRQRAGQSSLAMSLRIRFRQPSDDAEWLRMRRALWPDDSEAAHQIDMAVWLARADAAVLVAERPDRQGLAGFTEVGTRLYADGCDTSPVAYLEGWYVDRDARRQGIGAALVRAAEVWARERGYREFASDALLNAIDSQRAHEALGFIEVERAVRYRKRL
jgi:aminoglycoside 6'-N-acetyltransferase I